MDGLVPIDTGIPLADKPGTYVRIDTTGMRSGIPLVPQKILVIGPRDAATATAAELKLFQIFREDEGDHYAGVGSILADMCRTTFKANSFTPIYGIGINELAGGNQATLELTFGGPATAAGTLYTTVAGTDINIGIKSADTAAEIATAYAAAINADSSLPVIAAVNGGVAEQVDLTAKHKGETGNDVLIFVNYRRGHVLPAGVTTAFNNALPSRPSIGRMAGGTGNPDLTTVLDAIANEWFTTIICPWRDDANLDLIKDELNTRNDAFHMTDGRAYLAAGDTPAGLTSWAAGHNNEHVINMNCWASPSQAWQWAAWTAATVTYFAGELDPAKPQSTLPMAGLLPPRAEDMFTWTEDNQVLGEGISTFFVDPDSQVRIDRVVTTRTQNALGAEDKSLHSVGTVLVLSAYRYGWRVTVDEQFRLTRRKNNKRTREDLQAAANGFYKKMEKKEFVEDSAFFVANYRNEQDSEMPERINEYHPVNPVDPLLVIGTVVAGRQG